MPANAWRTVMETSSLRTRNAHVYLALVHHPVYDKNRAIVATSITNYDIHDISRLARTYELGGYYMVTPLLTQQALCRRIIQHWVAGFGKEYNQSRYEAFVTTYLADSLQDVIAQIQARFERRPVVIMTSAREYVAAECGKPLLSYRAARQMLHAQETAPYLIVLGTGYGIINACLEEYGDVVLAPIQGIGDYNHLSVRSAAAIMVDRLFGGPDALPQTQNEEEQTLT